MRKVFLPAIILCLLFSCSNNSGGVNRDTQVRGSTDTASSTMQQSEFADPMYTELGKKMMTEFGAANFDAYGTYLSDKVVYSFSAGDSMVGKKAVVDYWKNRFDKVVQSVQFSNDIWLPIKVNTPQRGPDMPGVWLITWQQVNARYRNGKSLQFWIHTDYHFDANNKVDRVVQYIDRAPINAITGTVAPASNK